MSKCLSLQKFNNNNHRFTSKLLSSSSSSCSCLHSYTQNKHLVRQLQKRWSGTQSAAAYDHLEDYLQNDPEYLNSKGSNNFEWKQTSNFIKTPGPLPLDRVDVLTQFKNYPSTPVVENIALINACLAQGFLFRVNQILKQIKHEIDLHNKAAQFNDLRMQDVIPGYIHTDYIRACFRLYISNPESGEKYLVLADRYFKSILKDPHEHGIVNVEFYSLFLKGLIATNTTEQRRPDSIGSNRLVRHLTNDGYSLFQVLTSEAFKDQSPYSLGKISAEDALDQIQARADAHDDSDVLEICTRTRNRIEQENQPSPLSELHDLDGRPELPDPSESFVYDFNPEDLVELDPVKAVSDEDTKVQQVHAGVRFLKEGLKRVQDDHTHDPSVRQDLLEDAALDLADTKSKHLIEKLKKSGLENDLIQQSKEFESYFAKWVHELAERIEHIKQYPSDEYRKLKEKEASMDVDKEESESKGKGSKRLSKFETNKVITTGRDLLLHEMVINTLGSDALAFVTLTNMMTAVRRGMSGDSIQIIRAVMQIADGIELEYQTHIYRNHEDESRVREINARLKKLKDDVIEKHGKKDAHFYLQRAWRYELKHSNLAKSFNLPEEWTDYQKGRLGSVLLQQALEVATLTRTKYDDYGNKIASEEQPAFYHQYQYHRGRKTGLLRMNEYLFEKLGPESLLETVNPKEMPMVVEPKPWTSYNNGGYRHSKNNVVRIVGNHEQLHALKASDEANQLHDVYEGLNALGRVPWAVNLDVFKAVAKIWNDGEAVGGLPEKDPLTQDLEKKLPPELQNLDQTDNRDTNLEKERDLVMADLLIEARAKHSKRCTINYVLEIARAYVGHKMYFPHNVDFRGRAYPLPPLWSHVGDDLARALLVFAEAKPLGDYGLDWLMVHLASSFGHSKKSFKDRVQFVWDNIDKVHESAENPNEGSRWWLTADKPWTALATCSDISRAIRSGDPKYYKSRLPIHADGTCNGLQHYAALGGDVLGAAQVNITPGEKPADIYSKIADMVYEEAVKEAEAGVVEAMNAKDLISRKVVKQTVMTTVYGVTFMGAKDQIMKQIDAVSNFTEEENYRMASYLTKKVLASIGDLFKGATKIQHWLAAICNMVTSSIKEEDAQAVLEANPGHKKTMTKASKYLMTSMGWTSPIGVPCLQPYRKYESHQITTPVQTLYISDYHTPGPVDKRAQTSAFPPNFVHSLDASHMLLTAVACSRSDLVFASVHDSFWTHACDIDKLGKILREQFIQLHSQDILENFRNEVIARFGDNLLPVVKTQSKTKLKTFYGQGKIFLKNGTKPTPIDYSIEPELEAGDLFKSKISSVFDAKNFKLDFKRTNEIETPEHYVRLADVVPPVPPRGDLDINIVKRSPYFFS